MAEGLSGCYCNCSVHRWPRDHLLERGNHLAWHKFRSSPSQKGFQALKSWYNLIWPIWPSQKLFLLLAIIRQDFASLSLTSLKVKGQVAATHNQRLSRLDQSESRNTTFTLPSPLLLPFRGEPCWCCCLVLYFPVLTPAPLGTRWRTFSRHLRHPLFVYSIGNLPSKWCSFKLSKHIGFWSKDLLWECYHYLTNEDRFFLQQSERRYNEAEKMSSPHCCQSPKSKTKLCL